MGDDVKGGRGDENDVELCRRDEDDDDKESWIGGEVNANEENVGDVLVEE